MIFRVGVLFVTSALILGTVPLRAQQGAAGDPALNELHEIKELLRVLVSRAQPAQPQSAPAVLVPVAPVSIEGAPTKGEPGAPVVIIEYADFQCPYCGEFARRVLPTLADRYIATGKVRLAFRNLPLQEIHPQALMAAATAECAAQQGKFWPVHDTLFSEQRLDDVSVIAALRVAGVDTSRFRECVQGPGAIKVRQELAVARSQGFNVTPTFLIGRNQGNGLVKVERIVTGLKDAATFATILDSLLDGDASLRFP